MYQGARPRLLIIDVAVQRPRIPLLTAEHGAALPAPGGAGAGSALSRVTRA
jgi:hypothetical protein